MSISITDTHFENKVVYYLVEVVLPLRRITVNKRYSDFVLLVAALTKELGISTSDFPYELPPKKRLFSNLDQIVAERKFRLSEFLNAVVRDLDLCNRRPVHRFLNLPQNFKFTRDLFGSDKEPVSDDKFLIDEDAGAITKNQWLTYLRVVKSSVQSLSTDQSMASRTEARARINKYVLPNVEKLGVSLAQLSQKGAISGAELKERTQALAAVQARVESVLAPEKKEETTGFLRPFERTRYEAVDTKDTIALSNTELLQRQQQIHKDQDSEVEALRKIIGRQKQIAQMINLEVEEQNEMLNQFNDEVEASTEKMNGARGRAKKIA